MDTKKVLRAAGKITAVIVGAVLLLCAGLYVNNAVRLHIEAPLTKPLGSIAEADGHRISIYCEGEGEHTLVFLQGGGLPCPILEARSLYSRLSDKYRIAVIERPGYGYSEECDELIPLEQELELERKALTQLGIDGPYILVPHSASGIEALLWAGKYPDEVEAIAGLDMSLPDYYKELYDLDEMRAEAGKSHFVYEVQYAFMRKLGIARFYDIGSILDSFKTGSLTEEDKAVYKAVAYKIYFNRTMLEGMLTLPEDIDAVESVDLPDIPMLMFISDGTQLGMKSPDDWISLQNDFAAAHGAQTVQLDCGHSMQNIEYVRISEIMTDFIEKLDAEGR